jgi:drug/metabolite transporter (DMT)-like permease
MDQLAFRRESGLAIQSSTPRSALLLVHASLLVTAILWGGNFTAIKYLLDRLEPFDVMFLRAAGAILFFSLFLLLTGRALIPIARADAIRLVLIGVIGITIMNLAMINGQKLLPAALASLIVTSNPIHTTLISRLLGGEPLTGRKIGGIMLAFFGFLIVLLFGSGKGADLSADHVKGMLIVALAPFSWAFYTVLSKPLLTRYPPVHVAAYTSIAGSIGFMIVPFARPGTVERIGDLTAWGWAAALFATLLAFVVSYVLWYRGLRVLTPSQTAVYIYLVPVFGLLSAWLILGETITAYLVLGGATILAGVVLTNSARSPRPVGRGARATTAPVGAVDGAD